MKREKTDLVAKQISKLLTSLGVSTKEELDELKERLDTVEDMLLKKKSQPKKASVETKQEKNIPQTKSSSGSTKSKDNKDIGGAANTICKSTKRDGTPCQAAVIPGSDYCIAHKRFHEK